MRKTSAIGVEDVLGSDERLQVRPITEQNGWLKPRVFHVHRLIVARKRIEKGAADLPEFESSTKNTTQCD